MRITRRYLACCTRRTTSTTIVFSILALVTLPISSVRLPCSATAAICVSAVITPYLPLPPYSIHASEAPFLRAPDLFWFHEDASALLPDRWKAENAPGTLFRSIPSADLPARCHPLHDSFQ